MIFFKDIPDDTKPVTKDLSFLIVKRLLGCLGNINEIKDTTIHKRVMEFIFTKWELFSKVSFHCTNFKLDFKYQYKVGGPILYAII